MFLQNTALLVVGFLFLPKHTYKECQKCMCHLHDAEYTQWEFWLQLVAFKEKSLQWCGRMDLGNGIPCPMVTTRRQQYDTRAVGVASVNVASVFNQDLWRTQQLGPFVDCAWRWTGDFYAWPTSRIFWSSHLHLNSIKHQIKIFTATQAH